MDRKLAAKILRIARAESHYDQIGYKPISADHYAMARYWARHFNAPYNQTRRIDLADSLREIETYFANKAA